MREKKSLEFRVISHFYIATSSKRYIGNSTRIIELINSFLEAVHQNHLAHSWKPELTLRCVWSDSSWQVKPQVFQDLEEEEIATSLLAGLLIITVTVLHFSLLLQALLRYPKILIFQELLGFSPVLSLKKWPLKTMTESYFRISLLRERVWEYEK